MLIKINVVENLVFVYLFFGLLVPAHSQEKKQINIAAFRLKDTIILTWQPPDYAALLTCVKSGYVLERYEIDETTISKKIATKKIWNINPAKMEGYESIRKYLYENSNFIALKEKSISDQNLAMENIFSFTLLGAYNSPEFLMKLGLRIVDYDIEESKLYFYNLIPNEIEYSGGSIVSSTASKLPIISLSNGIEQEKYIQINWPKRTNEDHYFGYEILRSKDGVNYTLLNPNNPIVGFTSEELPTDLFTFMDSLSLYDPYYYKVVGLSIFGIKSEPSEPIKLMCRDKTPPEPVNRLSYNWFADTAFTLRWQNTFSSDLSGHYVQRCLKVSEDKWETINDIALPKNTETFYHAKASKKLMYYYRVVSVDTAGNKGLSDFVKVTLLDSIAPATPTGLTGIIDSNGLVRLSWNANTEEDLNGYYVYFSNKKTHLFTNLLGHPIKKNEFVDTITLKTHTEEIYYRITAVDFIHNISLFTDILELKKPDKVPPSPPVFYAHKNVDNKIYLAWHPSAAKDVMKYLLYRKSGMDDYILYKEFGKEIVEYYDTSLIRNTKYQYKIIAEDDAGLQSVSAFPVVIKNVDNSPLVIPDNLNAEYDPEKRQINLTWQGKPGYKYAVYKARDENALVNVAYTTVNEASYTDTDLSKTKQQYSYAVAAISPDQRKSKLSEVVKIKIKKK